MKGQFAEPQAASGSSVAAREEVPAGTSSPSSGEPAVAAPTVHLPRLNAAGFCRQCLTRGCTDPRCRTQWRGFVWAECDTRHGSGSADYTLALANGGPDHALTSCHDCHDCHDGVLEVDLGAGTGRPQVTDVPAPDGSGPS